MHGAVRILTHTPDIQWLVGAASRLVTTEARGDSLWESSADEDRDERLARQLVRMGHLSVIEHAVVTLSFEDVSLLVEQCAIQHRLASFTVKSRRYVDFASSGFFVPSEIRRSEVYTDYRRYIDRLFDSYVTLQRMGVPREDARFVFPYCLNSNFLCTMNLRELCHLICRWLTGPESQYEEVRSLGESLRGQLEGIAPFLENTGIFDVHRFADKDVYNRMIASYDLPKEPTGCEAEVQVVNCTPCPDDVVASSVAAQLQSERVLEPNGSDLSADRLVRLATDGRYARHLEHAVFTFALTGMSLAGLTHLTRHRMQSLCVPDLGSTDLTARYVIPDTIRSLPEARTLYRDAAVSARSLQREMRERGVNPRVLTYLSICGNAIDIRTSINARELLHFFALRTCNRAQWEIRGVAEAMLSIVRKMGPRVFANAGPSCVRFGRCPEGRMTCGRASEMMRKYG